MTLRYVKEKVKVKALGKTRLLSINKKMRLSTICTESCKFDTRACLNNINPKYFLPNTMHIFLSINILVYIKEESQKKIMHYQI